MMTRAIRNALAYVYITGWMPKGIHQDTYTAVANLIELIPDTARFRVNPALVEKHPQVVKTEELASNGWKVQASMPRKCKEVLFTKNNLIGFLQNTGKFYYYHVCIECKRMYQPMVPEGEALGKRSEVCVACLKRIERQDILMNQMAGSFR